MTIIEVCIAAREKGMTYGQYVSKCLPHYTPSVQNSQMGPQGSRVYQYAADGQLVGVYPTIRAAEDAVGGGNIWKAIKYERMSMGFYWKRVGKGDF